MAYEFEKIKATLEGAVLVAIIDSPPANALGQGVLRDLSALLDQAQADEAVRVIVLGGQGPKLFSAGADIGEFAGLQAGVVPEYNGNEIFSRIETFPKVVIAAMQGAAFGGGLELCLCCHLRVMSEKAICGLPEVKLGFMPGWGGTQRLPRLIGKTKAMELILTGDFISANQALALGLVCALAPAEETVAHAVKLAQKLAAGAPLAQREIIKAIHDGLQTTVADGVKNVEGAGVATLLGSQDFKEGAKAFLEKRKAQFVGR